MGMFDCFAVLRLHYFSTNCCMFPSVGKGRVMVCCNDIRGVFLIRQILITDETTTLQRIYQQKIMKAKPAFVPGGPSKM